MSESQSNWYYFCSTGCGFCKKVEPLVEELNKENDNPDLEILRLDLADGDNEKLAKELKEKLDSTEHDLLKIEKVKYGGCPAFSFDRDDDLL